MVESIKRELEIFRKSLELYGEKTFRTLSSAFLIWLFGVLVFIPLAGSINREAEILCNLIFFTSFTLLTAWALPGFKKIVDSFSTLIAKSYGLKGGLSPENSEVIFRNLFYMVLIVIFYLFYSPFLMIFHPSINGMAIILLLVWIFFLFVRVLPIILTKMLERLRPEG